MLYGCEAVATNDGMQSKILNFLYEVQVGFGCYWEPGRGDKLREERINCLKIVIK